MYFNCLFILILVQYLTRTSINFGTQFLHLVRIFKMQYVKMAHFLSMYIVMDIETSDSLNHTTLEQGKIYKRLQQKILNGEDLEKPFGVSNKNRKNKRINKKTGNSANCMEGMEGFGLADQSSAVATQTLASQELLTRYNRLKTQFNDLLAQYHTAQQTLVDNTNAFVQNSNNNATNYKNIYVNAVINNPNATFLGYYKDDATNNSLTTLDGANSYDSCLAAATNAGQSVFGLKNVDSSGRAVCVAGTNIDAARTPGLASSGCTRLNSNDKQVYSAFNSPTLSLYDTRSGTYQGCYYNTDQANSTNTQPAMAPATLNMQNFASVYVLGPVGIGPWGNRGGFPDSTAQWIWYTRGAARSAPFNLGAPVTFVYKYDYTGSTIISATLYAFNDNIGQWYVNGSYIGQSIGGWGTPGNTFTISIHPGTNYIVCYAGNSGGPAGLAATCLYGNSVLFNTNGYWRFTNIPPEILFSRANSANYTVQTCRQYANDNNYQYFGVYNGSYGTSQCLVSNSLSDSKRFGSSEPGTTIRDHNYGTSGVNALYQINGMNQASADAVGKAGYVDEQSRLHEYPSSMIRANARAAPTLIGADSSCLPQAFSPIDSVAWNKYAKSGLMTATSKCGLMEAIQDPQRRIDTLKGQLGVLADQMIQIIATLRANNQTISGQINMNSDAITQDLAMYQDISDQFGNFKDLVNNNAHGVLNDSAMLVKEHNYHYIFWGILTLTVAIVTIHLLRQR